MSDYFTRQNTKEVGPGPTEDIEWLVVSVPEGLEETKCAIVMAKLAYVAIQKAAGVIEGLETQTCLVFPSPKIKMNLEI